MKSTVNLENIYGRLKVVARSESVNGRAMWECQCQCGDTETLSSKQLTTGIRTACKNCQDSGSKSSLKVRLGKYEVAENGCWNWTGKQNEHGYGVITVEGRYTRAHRAMYFMINPKADTDLVVMHRCDNPRCINPEHLALGTQKENMMDMHAKGRFRGGAPIGNSNATGNEGWKKGGVTAKYCKEHKSCK